MRPPALQILMFPVLPLVTEVRYIVAPAHSRIVFEPSWFPLPLVRRLAFKRAPATVPEEARWWPMRLSAASTQPTGGSSAHGTTIVLVGEFSIVFYTVFVVAKDGVGGAYGDEAVGGMWVITVAVGVMGFAQLKVAPGECVRLWGG